MEKYSKYDVSIIVPVYNSSNYIEKCLRSLFEQDYESIEYIFVNDCSTDNSLTIIENILLEYPNRKNNTTIINNINNIGSSQSREIGLNIAKGDYILFFDSDDWTETNMVSRLFKLVRKYNYDIIVSDYYINSTKEEVYFSQFVSSNKSENLENILLGNLKSYLPNKLIKRNLFIDNNIVFPKFNLLEDKLVMTKLFFYSDLVGYDNTAFLHYRQNESSLTHKINHKSIEDLKMYSVEVDSFLKEKNIFNKYRRFFYAGILSCVLGMLPNYKYEKYINYICKEADSSQYLALLDMSNYKKLVYKLTFYKLGFIVDFLKYFTKK
ncbi:hypothetical protein A6A19_08250 [Actinobacillus delphinicola]|uniref:glycosyltransferase family 2 protein n=1 Tax=Actinobacillus delphinicola TaxID=51161 RepID=UPI0024435B1A|nr:glycosyltransferase family 2 protein [Actinobacillus delphinicola]MDG6897964.1 hypothetical protein [Actinobacillus delphinicola]